MNSVDHLRLKYPGEDRLLFNGLSLSVRRGEKVLLLGPSGCGKSTLLQVMCGLVPEAVDLPMKYDDRIVPERWAYVFQDPDTQFCMPYADEELAFTLENLRIPQTEMQALIRKYMRLVGLDSDKPHVLIESLSQGMKQRLAIASALALEPDVLFLDEPTALLDSEGTLQVWDTIKSLAGDKTLIIVEHKIDEIIHEADRVILLDADGKIAADETPERFFRHNRDRLTEYGIWYPGIWNDVDRLESFKERPVPAHADHVSDIVLKMSDFNGFRGSEPKIRVESACVEAGEWISIVGSNGAGKSSLLLAIMRLIRTEGLCRVCGYEGTKTKRISEEAGFVFQNPEMQFLTHSVEAELMFTLSKGNRTQTDDRRIAEQLLCSLGLEEYRDRHPYQLSMGQKRRLSVATALSGGKKLLLLDEPTFGLDAKSAFQVLDMLERLRCNGTAILMATHDQEIVRRYSTRVWTIEDGVMREGSAWR